MVNKDMLWKLSKGWIEQLVFSFTQDEVNDLFSKIETDDWVRLMDELSVKVQTIAQLTFSGREMLEFLAGTLRENGKAELQAVTAIRFIVEPR